MNKTILKSNNEEVVAICENECSNCVCKTKANEINVKLNVEEITGLDVKGFIPYDEKYNKVLEEVSEVMLGYNSGKTIISKDGVSIQKRQRGFEVVTNGHRKNIDKEIQLPVRGDSRSAGYDIRTPHKVTIPAGESVLIWTDIKAYMLDDEVLKVYVRSSIGTKKGLILKNVVGIIDSSYYSNVDNDGNIGVCLKNTTDKDVHLDEQERICQGVFQKYLVADDDVCLNNERTGGFGSSGTK